MPIPDKSHFQELLDQPVSLESRIVHLVAYIDIDEIPVGEVNSEYFIARQLDSNTRWVRSKAKEIGLKVLNKGIDQSGVEYNVYDSPALELLREEWWWRNETCVLDKEVMVKEFERLLGKTEKWVVKYAYELGVVVNYVPSPSGGKARMLPRTVLHQLRHIILMFPPQQDWYTEFELSQVSGHDDRWLATHLGRVGIHALPRWSDLTGKLLNFYPPESPDVIRAIEANQPRRAGNWLTAAGVARKIDMSDEWTTTRLRELQDPTAEIRLNDYNVPKLHYSPKTIARVEKLAVEIRNIPEINDWHTVSGLARQLDVKEPWVRRRLPFLKSIPEPRRDPSYRIFNCYPPGAITELEKMRNSKFSDVQIGNF